MGKYYEDFVEGEYDECDGDITQRAVQALHDRERAVRLAQYAEVRMESAWMAERERIAAETGERGAALDAIMNQYLKEDKYQQYLVDGAILRCENATLADFELPNGEKVVLEKVTEQSDTERTHIRLCVSENFQGYAKENEPEDTMSIGGLAYATVKDTMINKNIIPPFCNCKIAANRDKEVERIMADPERNKHGVCMHLMQLNSEWRNLWKQGQSYLSKTNRIPDKMTVGFGDMSAGNGMSEKVTGGAETVPGITMTSMLFCKHGGIIMPVTSGQVIETGYEFEKIDKIVEQNGDVWQEETVFVARYVSRRMLDNGYPIEIIAGVVGNFVNEGRFGEFESSAYESNQEPRYLIHMDQHHSYETLASGKYLSDVGTGILEQLKNTGSCNSEEHSYGLGAAQWSEGRCDALVEEYLKRFGGNAYPTMEECREVEIDFMLFEFENDYKKVIEHCEKIMQEKATTEEQIDAITEIIFDEYEKPGTDTKDKRKSSAQLWYTVMTGEYGNDGQ